MNPAARPCPRCRKPVVAGILCPDCGLLEHAHDPPLEPLPEEYPRTESTGPGPSTCLKCGHAFPPGTPEPCRCPECHTLCSILDAPPKPPPMPEECPLTDGERARWRVWFWVLLLLGPALALLAFPLSQTLGHALPAGWRPFLKTGGPLMALGLPVVAALGAAFCLAQSQIARRTAGELVAFTLLMALLFLFTEAAIVFVGCSVLVNVLK